MMRIIFIALLLSLCSFSLHAHRASDAYLTLRINGDKLSGQWEIALRDLEQSVGLDTNEDGKITWDELRAQRGAVTDYAFSRLRLQAGSTPLSIHFDELLVD